MEFKSNYQAYEPDANGFVAYKVEENLVWNKLFTRQIYLIKKYASKEFVQGVECLGLNDKEIPQLPEISEKLTTATGWQVVPVKAIISAREFFNLLAKRCFPAATFIRRMDSLDYVKEPDIFHELFGHCPMLTDQTYADFLETYAKYVLRFDESEWPLLQRFFWFTVEFGLIRNSQGLKVYGGGILSSIKETQYSVESSLPLRVLFEPLQILRTPYRIDSLQSVYFVINDYAQLYNVFELNMDTLLQKAHNMGEFAPLFPVEENNPNIHINYC